GAVIQADLSDGSLARLMTIALIPMHASDPDVSASPDAVNAELALIETRRYYRAVAYLLDDLQQQNKKATDYTKTALWHEKFAHKIDDLPQANVDQDLVKYGYATASKLRAISQSLRGVPIQMSAAA